MRMVYDRQIYIGIHKFPEKMQEKPAMRIGKWRFLLIIIGFTWPAVALPDGQRLPLPASAKIHIGQKKVDTSSNDIAWCKGYTVSQRSIRQHFATYLDITGNAWHFLYSTAPCSVHGTIIIGDKTFTWEDNPRGWLATNYPDGVEKELGSSNPKYIDNTH